MRTKTLALSAVLGLLGSVSAMAANVYSINAVGYINVAIPSGWSMVTCPLVCSPDNTIATIFNNTTGTFQPNGNNAQIFLFTGGSYSAFDIAGEYSGGAGGWVNNGTLAINPGQAAFFDNTDTGTINCTFVGTVPQNGTVVAGLGSTATGLTNTLIAGWNMVGSVVPVSGDLVASSISGQFFNSFAGPPTGPAGASDFIYIYDPVAGFEPEVYFAPVANGGWTGGTGTAGPGPGNPATTSVTQGFFYYNGTGSSETWVENFVINP
jgi:hypothetical protein